MACVTLAFTLASPIMIAGLQSNMHKKTIGTCFAPSLW